MSVNLSALVDVRGCSLVHAKTLEDDKGQVAM